MLTGICFKAVNNAKENNRPRLESTVSTRTTKGYNRVVNAAMVMIATPCDLSKNFLRKSSSKKTDRYENRKNHTLPALNIEAAYAMRTIEATAE